MSKFYELCLQDTSEKIKEFSEELGWHSTNCDMKTIFLESEEWGKLKREMQEHREEADILVFYGGDEELNRKVVEDGRIDILLHPEKDRKDSGIDHVIAEEAAENEVTIGLDLRQLFDSAKNQSHVLTHWRKNLSLCEKYGAPYIITTCAEDKLDLRAPRELASLVDSLGYDGRAAVSDNPAKIVERAQERRNENRVKPGVKVVDGGDEDEKS